MPPKKTSPDPDFARTYYEHQYDRVEKDEHHRLTITNFVLTLSALAFTFGFENATQLTAANGVGLPLIIISANIFSILYINRTSEFIDVHRNRAHDVLQRYAPDLSEIDKKYPLRPGLLNSRIRIEKGIHQLIIVIALIPLGLFLYQQL